MTQRSGYDGKKGFANAVGSLGYLFCFLQWFWAITLYFSIIQSTTSFISSGVDTYAEQPTRLSFELPGPVGAIILGVTVISMIALTVYAFISLPRSIIRTSNKIVHKAAETMTPVIIKAGHKHDTKKTRIKITSRLALIIKLLLTVIPIVLTATSYLQGEQVIDHSIAMVVGLGLACISVAFFFTQYVVAVFFKVKIADLW
jgi:hypothetical protein